MKHGKHYREEKKTVLALLEKLLAGMRRSSCGTVRI